MGRLTCGNSYSLEASLKDPTEGLPRHVHSWRGREQLPRRQEDVDSEENGSQSHQDRGEPETSPAILGSSRGVGPRGGVPKTAWGTKGSHRTPIRNQGLTGA